MSERRSCTYVIDSIRNDKRRGTNNRPWWRRSCKRNAVEGEQYCWQHLPTPRSDFIEGANSD